MMTSQVGYPSGFDWGLQRSRSRTGEYNSSKTRSSESASSTQQSWATGFRSKSTAAYDIRTAEGDRVTISVDALAQFGAAYQSSGSKTAAAVSSSSASKVQVKIEGDLSSAELKEITDLISALGIAVGKAGSGEQSGASSLAKTLSGLTTLSGFDFTYRQQVEAGSFSMVA
jgi:hypothetical protein